MFDDPISHILTTDGTPGHMVAKCIKPGNGLTRGFLYQILAVNHEGSCAVAQIDNLTKPIEGPKGRWHPMHSFAWRQIAEVAANDN